MFGQSLPRLPTGKEMNCMHMLFEKTEIILYTKLLFVKSELFFFVNTKSGSRRPWLGIEGSGRPEKHDAQQWAS